MASLEGDVLLDRAISELEAARKRVRDLEGFVRVYTELVGRAHQVHAAPIATTAGQQEAVAASPARRPAIILADPDLSISEAAEKILRHFGREMKAREIAETMLEWKFDYKGGDVRDLRASVGAVLSREVREGGVFSKPATGTFGLKEWGGVNVADGEEEQEEHPALLLGDGSSAGWHRAGEVVQAANDEAAVSVGAQTTASAA